MEEVQDTAVAQDNGRVAQAEGTPATGVSFDATRLTAGDLMDLNIPRLAAAMAKAAVSAPPGWGDKAKPDTFAYLPLPVFQQTRDQFELALAAASAGEGLPDGWELDVGRIPALHAHRFTQGVAAQMEALSAVVDDWPDTLAHLTLTDPAAWREVPWPQFRRVRQYALGELERLSKN